MHYCVGVGVTLHGCFFVTWSSCDAWWMNNKGSRTEPALWDVSLRNNDEIIYCNMILPLLYHIVDNIHCRALATLWQWSREPGRYAVTSLTSLVRDDLCRYLKGYTCDGLENNVFDVRQPTTSCPLCWTQNVRSLKQTRNCMSTESVCFLKRWKQNCVIQEYRTQPTRAARRVVEHR